MFFAICANASIPHAGPPPLKTSTLVELSSRAYSFTNHTVTLPVTIIPDSSGSSVKFPYPIRAIDYENVTYDVTTQSEFVVVAEVRHVSLFAVTDYNGLHDVNSSPIGWYEVDCSVVSEISDKSPFNDFRFVTCTLIADTTMPYFKNRCFQFGFNKTDAGWIIDHQQLVSSLPPYQKNDHMSWRKIRNEKTTDDARIQHFSKIINDLTSELKTDGNKKVIIDISVEQDMFFVITLSNAVLLGVRDCLDYGEGISTLIYDWKTGSPLHGDGLEYAFGENLLRYARMYDNEKELWTEVTDKPVDKKYTHNGGVCEELPVFESVLSALSELGRRGIEPDGEVSDEELFEWQVTFLHGSHGRTLTGQNGNIFHMYKVANSYFRSIWTEESSLDEKSDKIDKNEFLSFDFFNQNEMRIGTNAPVFARHNTLYTFVSNSIIEEVYSKERLKEYLATMRRIDK